MEKNKLVFKSYISSDYTHQRNKHVTMPYTHMNVPHNKT